MKKGILLLICSTLVLAGCDVMAPKTELVSNSNADFEYRIKQLEYAHEETNEQLRLLQASFKSQMESNTKVDKAALEEVMLGIKSRLSDIKESYQSLWQFLESSAPNDCLYSEKGLKVRLMEPFDNEEAIKDLIDGPESLYEYINSSFENKGFGSGIRFDMKGLKRPVDIKLPKKYDSTKVPIAEIHEVLKNRILSLSMLELAFYRALLDAVAGPVLTYDRYTVLNSPEASQLFLGDTYRSEIALGAYSSQAEFSVQVNGRNIKNNEGITIFEEKAKNPGRNTYEVKISIVNPLTGETESIKKEYSYWVVEKK